MKKIALITISLLFVVSLVSCNLPVGEPGQSDDIAQTAIALNVALTQFAA